MSLLPNDTPIRDSERVGTPVTYQHWALARERVLSDLDTLADWLAGECMRQTRVSSERIERNADLMPARAAAAGVPELLHLLLNTGDAHTMHVARAQLVARYLAEKAGYVYAEAQDIANICGD